MSDNRMVFLRVYEQPSGVRIGLSYGQMPNDIYWFALRTLNGSRQEEWLNWPLKTVKRIVRGWSAFEKQIGSQPLF